THNDLIAGTNAQQQTERYHYQGHLFTQRVRASGFSHYFEWEGEGPAARCVHNWGDDGRYDYHFEYVDDERLAISTDGRGQVWKFWHDEEGRLISKQSPSGHQWQYEFDQHGQKVAERSPNGGTTQFTYNERGQLVSVQSPDGAITQYQYNGLGQRIVTIDAEGGVWQQEYSVVGHLKKTTLPNGAQTQFRYNEQSQLVEIERPDGALVKYRWNEQGQLLARAMGEQLFRYSYDELGRLNGVLDGSGVVTQYTRDDKGQLISIKAYEESDPGNAQEQRFQYDDSGRLIQNTDAQGRTHQYQFEGLSQPTKQIRPDGSWLHYQYDNERNLTGIQRSDGNEYLIEYDGEELPTKLTGFDGRQQSLKYDGEGRLIESDDCGEKAVRLKRDLQGRVTEQLGRSHKTQETQSNYFQYDKLGRVTFANNADRKLRFQYDANGQLLEHWQDQWKTEHQYDQAGRRTQTLLPDGQTVQFHYDKHGRLNQLGLNDQPLTLRKFDQQDREIERECSNGVLLKQSFDAFGKITQQQWHNLQNASADQNEKEGQNQAQLRSYQYEKTQLVAIEDNQLGKKAYVYDELDQLISVQNTKNESHTSESFEWDSFGNPAGDGVVVENDRLIKNNGSSYRYDACGNQIQVDAGKADNEAPKHQTREFDGFNQLRRLRNNGKVNHYQYDALGRRSAKLTEQGKTDYLWDGDQLIGEHHQGKFRWYIYQPNTFLPIALVEEGQVYHYHLDHLGTPIQLTDNQGQTAWQADYTAFGEAQVIIEQVNNPIRFQGQYFDQESSLHYNRFRYYDPEIGRFIHQDPIGLVGGINHYQYAPNPVQWVDPFGLKCKEQPPQAANNLSETTIPENYDPVSDTFKGVDINLFSTDEAIHYSAKNVDNKDDIFIVGGHGSPDRMVDQNRELVTPVALARMIKNHPKYQEGMQVYLLSCSTGQGSNSFAEQLTKEMGGPVTAPTTLAWYWSDGTVRPFEAKAKLDENGRVVKDGNGNPVKEPDYSKPGTYRTFDI
ncbi:RHS repeat-associated core domain-containing protein, partial [Litoribacillus peritrichatus]